MHKEPVFSQIEALGVHGAAMAFRGQSLGFRGIPLLPGTGLFDHKLPIRTLTELGPYDPRDRYHHVAFQVPTTMDAARKFLAVEAYDENAPFVPDLEEEQSATLHLEWFVRDEALYARYSTNRALDLMLLMNGCLDPAEVLEVDESISILEQSGVAAVLQVSGDVFAFAEAEDVHGAESAIRGWLPKSPHKGRVAAQGVHLRPDTPLTVRLGLEAGAPDPVQVDEQLRVGRTEMEQEWPRSSGSAAHCADALQRLVGFSKAFDPQAGRWCVPVNRDWAGPNQTPITFMWDNFLDAYLAVWSQPELARDSLVHILNVIDQKGLEGAPPQRNLIVPVIYSKLVRILGDKEFARETFPVMMRFMRFWFEDRGDGHPRRDGNDDGLIESGSCLVPGDAPLHRILQNAFDETGYDDSPMYSAGFGYQRRGLPADGVEYRFDRGTLNLTLIGQNSLYIAACRAMAVVADWAENPKDHEWLLVEAERVTDRIRTRLFDPERGYYNNRFFDGRFSPVKTMTIFYPLMAGLCDDETAGRLKEAFADPEQFGGENVIPTVSRDDSAYREDPPLDTYWRGNYWRGSVWPPTNYITYLALRNTDWSELETEFVRKSRRLFMDDWLPRHHAMENYPPNGNTTKTKLFYGNGGRNPHYVWAGLLPMMTLEQLFSVEDTGPGIRFGTLAKEEYGSWDNFLFQGQRASIRVDAEGVELSIPDRLVFSSSQPIAVRHFDVETGAFQYRAATDVTVNLQLENRSPVILKLNSSANNLTLTNESPNGVN